MTVVSRKSIYQFDDYNPYLPSGEEQALVHENLLRLKNGRIDLQAFLKQTPQFARWQDEHINQARVLLITNEPGLSDIDKLYGGLVSADSVDEVADLILKSMLSWLSLTNHSALGAVNGEHYWSEGASWELEFPALARCGKIGYFLLDGEEQVFCRYKALHLDLSAFPQGSSLDVNPRNDQRQAYHAENCATVEAFCRLATPEEPRYVFIIANRAHILRHGTHAWQVDTTETTTKDKSSKIIDLLRTVDTCGQSIEVRLCRQSPRHGRPADVYRVTASIAYELQPVGPADFRSPA